MEKWLVSRAKYASGLLWQERWRRAVLFLWFVFTAWSSVESQLPDDVQDDIPGILAFFSYGPWYMWALIGTGLLAAIAIDAGYRQSQQDRGSSLPPQIAQAMTELETKSLDEFFLKYGKLLASGGGPTDFMGDRSTLQELRLLGLVEFHHFPGRPSFGPEPSIGDQARDVPYLSDLGTEVYRALEDKSRLTSQ